MKTYLTIADMMLRLRIPQSNYTHFRNWCYKNKDKLDTQLCKWNHGYTLYNVKLVSEKYPFPERFGVDKVSTPETIETPVETPLDAAERLAVALSTTTGKKTTGADVLAAFERGKDYIRMRRQMARVLWRMRKERRRAQNYSKYARNYSNSCMSACLNAASHVNTCDNLGKSCKVNAERAEKAEKVLNVIMFVIFVICAITMGTIYEIVN